MDKSGQENLDTDFVSIPRHYHESRDILTKLNHEYKLLRSRTLFRCFVSIPFALLSVTISILYIENRTPSFPTSLIFTIIVFYLFLALYAAIPLIRVRFTPSNSVFARFLSASAARFDCTYGVKPESDPVPLFARAGFFSGFDRSIIENEFSFTVDGGTLRLER